MAIEPSRFLEFKQARPFHDLVATFLSATLGIADVFDPNNPRAFSSRVKTLYEGRQVPFLSIDQEQVHRTALDIPFDRAVALLCAMLANAAFEAVRVQLPITPVTEVLRHVRNAASHDNRFTFSSREPSRPAAWRSLVLNDALKGSANPLHGVRCFPDTLGPADLVALLWDVEQLLP